MANNTFKALGHPIRRRIVERLSRGPASVGEATRDFGVSKPTVTGHLRVLEEAGVVVREIHGRRHDLRLAVEPLDEASTWLDTQRARWTRLFDTVEAYLGERKGHDD
ncbi:MAG: ArsR/SmtB family transcription factor [Acidimicrobiia bacterium]